MASVSLIVSTSRELLHYNRPQYSVVIVETRFWYFRYSTLVRSLYLPELLLGIFFEMCINFHLSSLNRELGNVP